jgi:RecB family exonuclease
MPFRTPAGARRDLLTLIDAELRDRLEEAVDHACLGAMVAARQARGAPPPRADDGRDREEFTATVRALLERLRDEIPAAPDTTATDALAARAEVRDERSQDVHADEEWRLLALQLARAKALPDYWQRFEAIRVRFTDEYVASGGTRRGVLGRLFGRG